MKTTNNNTSFLHSVTEHDTAILIHPDNSYSVVPIINDSEGRIGYVDGGKFVLLPVNFQPRLVLR